MNTPAFKKLINQHFSPQIRQLGWQGTGSNFYQRTPYHVVNIFGIQGSWAGGSVSCETAIHFDFIPNPATKKINISNMHYASCLIRKRLSPKGEGDYHWAFSDNEEQNLRTVDQLWNAFERYGLAFYRDFANFPHPFDHIQPEDLQENGSYRLMGKYPVYNPVLFAWLLKEVNVFLGRSTTAHHFSAWGMNQALQQAAKMSANAKSKKAKDDIAQYLAANKDLFRSVNGSDQTM